MCILTPVREVEGLLAAREGVRRKAEVEGGRVRLAEGDGAGTSGLRLLTVSWPPRPPVMSALNPGEEESGGARCCSSTTTSQ